MKFHHSSRRAPVASRIRKQRLQKTLLWVMLCTTGVLLGFTPYLLPQLRGAQVAIAQTNKTIQNQEDQFIRQFQLPKAPPPPVYQPQPAPPPAYPADPGVTAPAPVSPSAPANPSPGANRPEPPKADKPASVAASSQYVMEFNRSKIVGDRLRLRGPYAEAQLEFTRPRNWKLESAKAIIRFQHSPALLATRSNLTVRVNGTSIGSVPLDRRQSQIGQVRLNIPANLIRDYNEITLVAQQNNTPGCSDPADQTLWTEVLPDSRLVFNYQPQPIALDLSQYPYPFFDKLSLDPSQIAYLTPTQFSSEWLTTASRFQAAIGRLADFRPVDARLIKNLNQLRWNDRLVVIGTPQEQPLLKSLKLPYTIASNQLLDGGKTALPPDVGVLMVTTAPESGLPMLVATGNSADGVAKAVQALVQPQNRQLNTGQAVLVTDVEDVPSPPLRQWSRYLPTDNSFKLSDLKGEDDKPFQDVTVRGAYSPPVEFDFRALPDDQFVRGSSMNLRYSYSPQVNPRLSAIEVRLDGAPIGGARLDSVDGGTQKTLNVNLPPNLVKPDSKIQVAFSLSPREPGECGRVTDQQLWGTVHADTSFKINRINSVQLPDLKLLQAGFPFAAPQDLSRTTIVLPDTPSTADVVTLLEFSERLGRLSDANSIKLQVYTTGKFPDELRSQNHLVGIGTRDRFPFPEVFEKKGFSLKDLFSRQSDQGQVQALPDNEGLVREIISPWNGDRVLLALTSQTDSGLNKVRDLLSKDMLFFQLQEDTALINTTAKNPSDYDPDDYKLEFFQRSQPQRIEQTGWLGKSTRFLQNNWFLLPTGIVVSALLLYGIVQLYLKRVATPGGAK